MKFTDGYWMTKEGITMHNPVEIRDLQVEGQSISIDAACKNVRIKGDTLNAPLLHVDLSSPRKDIIRVRWTHHAGEQAKGPHFDIFPEHGFSPEVKDEEAAITLTSGGLSVKVDKQGPWNLAFTNYGKYATGSRSKRTAYLRTQEKEAFFREQLDLGVSERIYGLGERFTPFVKNGQVVDIWNEDGGTSSEQAYKNVPFYLSSEGYGVFVNHPERVSFEIASENVSKVQFSVPGETLEYFIVGGETLKDVLANYTALTGKPALPPAWSFGLWLTTSFTTDYDEATVNSFIQGMADRDLPLHVFHFDCFWMKEYQWCDFEWDPAVFPDPVGMLKRLKDRGLKICVWINSYIAQKSPLFKEGKEKGYLVKRPNGDVWQWDMWQAGMGLVDFTNPHAVRWYQDHLRRLVDMGVDCFKTDFGERIPTDVVYFDGSDPVKMHNFYTQLYNKAVFEVLEEKLGKNEAMLFARSATAGGQQYPVHWGGDCSATYESMAETVRGGLSLGLSGFGFWSHDISGFESTAPPDIYKRWVAFGLLSSHSRLHGNESYRVPWLFDEEAVDVLRHFTKLKSRLMPYLFDKAVEASQKGLPVMRAMVLEYPEDPTTHSLDLQYMLGDKLLVAPIFRPDGRVQYYAPEGRWTNFFTGGAIEGGKWHTENHDYMSLPLLVAPNTLLAVGANDQKPDYDYQDGITFQLFELADGATATAPVYTLGGELVYEAKAERTGGTIIVTAEGASKTWSVQLRGISSVAAVEGATVTANEQGVLLTASEGSQRIVITL
ncbi:alpha-D-xyloside xylohydrolase [Paenibacillus phyllosphaerae]|uniref:alpha-D-xyloside xylohydrolase n=1 Tax=Paenibacillus phyllosphaerae TaxID=274593 RepID=A0A7W5AUS3_9BACL|nr:alpha-xylosidase [Paenibacillus phyllosphaerae]MBB3108992.1 alpha-D-xyloside xylohydrolase [Paenibacillus phyllosphaerae]